jgi:glutamate-1-semialdehyde aminotransferase/malonyl CoA-acyl carrier protein transacylase/aryl carrier-like protein
VVVCRSSAEAAELLGAAGSRPLPTHRLATAPPPVALMFPGQGSQHPGMGRELHRTEPVFRAEIDRCAEMLRPHIGGDLRDPLLSDDGAAARAMGRTELAQPAIFSVEYALAVLWQHRGLRPDAMIGHSVGEFVCAVLAGVISLQDALWLVASRGRLMQELPAGSMLAVGAAAAALEERLRAHPAVGIAAENAPASCVVSGPVDGVERLRAELEAEGTVCRPLRTSHAFHSAMMDPAVEPFAELVGRVALRAPRSRFVSSVTGTWITAEQATDPGYWARHMREPVRFAQGVRTLWAGGGRLLLEVGPGSTLAGLARRQLRDPAAQSVVASLGDTAAGEAPALLGAAGQLWLRGVALDWHALHGRSRGRVSLPSYPFERQSFWIHPAAVAAAPPLTVAAPAAAPEAPPQAARPDEAGAVPSPGTARIDALRELVESVTGLELAGLDSEQTFLELGLDSLSLTQVALQLRRRFGVRLSFRQLMENHPSLAALARHLETEAPSVAPPAGGDPPPAAEPVASVASAAEPVAPAAPRPSNGLVAYDPEKPFGAIARIHGSSAELTPLQRTRLDALIRRYTARTRTSKRLAAEHRAHLADPRTVSGFRPALKELVYQITVERSSGSRLWDVDGNEYVDVLNGFGASLLGWQPRFVTDAVSAQLARGYEIGPMHPLAGEVARLVCELTGFERAGFCNTGSEAVLGALRIARTVTGRSLVAIFSGSYHGIFDEVVVRGTRRHRAVPAAPGILPSAADNILVLEYGAPESLEILRSRASELAAVVVEPVQSRRPELQPRAFLHDLRQLTREAGIAYVFDEMVTGFRTAPGGAQEHFEVRGDIATYGKAVGGGFPIGIIAGTPEWMDALDGGHWQYGDGSTPTVGVTYFAGTFVRHPLALAAAHAVLEHLRREGPELQRRLNRATAEFAGALNAHLRQTGAPIEIRHFGSLWRTAFLGDHPYGDLLFTLLRDRGVHLLDGFPCFFTTAHSAADIELVAAAYRESVAEMQESGFLPRRSRPVVQLDARRPPVPGARLGRDAGGVAAWFVPNPEEPGRYVALRSAG